jgi:hypothetical protein
LRTDPDASLPWLRTLALLYPAWPDFRILQGEQDLRSATDNDVVARAATALSSYTLPFTTETLGYAAAHAAVVARRPDAVSSVAAAAATRVVTAVGALQPGGFFCVMYHL